MARIRGQACKRGSSAIACHAQLYLRMIGQPGPACLDKGIANKNSQHSRYRGVQWSRKERIEPMVPDARKCDAALPNGTQCAELARVIGVQYHYGPRPSKDGSLEQHLNEAHYQIHCPKCGVRKQVERPAADC